MPRPPTRAVLVSLTLAVLSAAPLAAAPLPLVPDGWLPVSGSSGLTGAPGISTRASAGSAAPAATDLVTTTLPLDISTASFYELVDWVRSLGLSDSGSADDLRKRLYDHYDVKAPEVLTGKGRTVTIVAADRADYTSDKSDSGIVSLSGGVQLSIVEDSGDTFTISARKVVYDRGKNSVYASGTVVYTRTTKGKTEEFRGSTLAADLDDWSGLFLDGVWRQQGASLGSSDRGLTFSSASLQRISGDFITLSDVSVSPGTGDTPNFSIRANRLWFLGESDWAALSALIYVGEVPVLWIPFFYYPSEEIIFHPVFGYDSRAGSYLQTTTWLLGQKPASTTTSSIIQFAQSSGPTQARGIFLKHTTGSASGTASAAATPSGGAATVAGSTGTAAPGTETNTTTSTTVSSDSLELLADWYVGLGGFMGLDGSLQPRGILNKLSLSSGIGVSRSLFPVLGGVIYSPYDASGNWASVWNQSDLLGISLPIRYGGDLSLGLTLGSIQASLDLPLYSDSFFEQDFRSRKFDQDWLGTSASTSATLSSSVAARSSFAQKLSFTGTLPVSFLSPWVQTLGLTLNSTFSWLTKTDANLMASESLALWNVDPARQFFYPDNLRPVDLTLNMTGTILNLAGTTSAAAPAAAGSTTGAAAALPSLKAPWDEPAADAQSTGSSTPGASSTGASPKDDQGGEAQSSGLDFAPPTPAPDPTLATPPVPIASKVTWTLQPGLVLEREFLSDSWAGASAVDYAKLWDLASWKMGATLASSVALFGSALTGGYTLTWADQEQVRQLTDNAAYSGTTSAVALSDAQYPSRKLSGALSLASQPFPSTSVFAPSNLSWSFNSTLYSWSFGSWDPTDPTKPLYAQHFAEWSTNSISANTVGLTLAVKTGPTQQSLALTANLPPLTESYAATLGLAAKSDYWSLSIGGQERAVRQTGGNLTPTPISASVQVGAPLGITLSDSATWDFTVGGPEGGFTSNATTATWGWATATLQSQYAQMLTPEPNVGWVATGGMAFIPASFTASFTPSYTPPKDAIWQPTLSASLTYNQSLLQFSNSTMVFGLSVDLKLGSNFTLDISSQSQNSSAWLYWPSLFSIPSDIPVQAVNPWTDILDSLSVWDTSKLYAANFKLKSLSMKLSQDLGDWTLSASATATPTLYTPSTGALASSYWYINPSFSVNIAWKDIPFMKNTINYQSTVAGASPTLSW